MTILLIGEDGTKIGNISFREAKEIAKEQGKDLIEVNKNKGVYKIGDAGKLKYEQKRRDKKKRAQQRNQKVKEIQFRPTIEDGDLQVKLRRVREFLEDGLKTKLVMKFKRQQMAYRDSGMQKMSNVVEQIVQEGLAAVDKPPRFEGNNINVFLIPKQ